MELGLESILFFLFVSLGASTVNGALGYGFSSISIPLAVLFFSNRVLNPAFVLVEISLNGAILFFERHHARVMFSRSAAMIVSLLPGVLLGSYLLSIVSPVLVRISIYVVLLPLVLVQAAGFRRPISSELAAKFPIGIAVGALYSLTTISGPPLALFWNNQGLTKNEFRAALAQIRVAEGLYTAIAYQFLGLYSPLSFQISAILFAPVFLGIPIGRLLIRAIRVETFRRICMSFDAWIIGYGLAQTTIDLRLASIHLAYTIWGIVVLIDSWLLYRFFNLSQSRRPIFHIGSRAS